MQSAQLHVGWQCACSSVLLQFRAAPVQLSLAVVVDYMCMTNLLATPLPQSQVSMMLSQPAAKRLWSLTNRACCVAFALSHFNTQVVPTRGLIPSHGCLLQLLLGRGMLTAHIELHIPSIHLVPHILTCTCTYPPWLPLPATHSLAHATFKQA